MIPLHHLLHMRRLIDHPPSRRRVIAVCVAIALCLVVWGLEQFNLWPDWATAERMRSGVGFNIR